MWALLSVGEVESISWLVVEGESVFLCVYVVVLCVAKMCELL